jgi:hypothetical protein
MNATRASIIPIARRATSAGIITIAGSNRGRRKMMCSIHLDLPPVDDCRQETGTLGQICVRCNECGRFGRPVVPDRHLPAHLQREKEEDNDAIQERQA